jgi:hypothetical protein
MSVIADCAPVGCEPELLLYTSVTAGCEPELLLYTSVIAQTYKTPIMVHNQLVHNQL